MTSSNKNNPDIKYPPNNEGRQSLPISRPNVTSYERNGQIIQGPSVDTWAEAPSGGTYVLASINGTIQWIETESCDE
jgi:hypothetical protein